MPDALPSVSGSIYPSSIIDYSANGYGNWHYGLGVPIVRRTDLNPSYTGTATNVSKLLSFFAISDIHIGDKEAPDQAIFEAYQLMGGNSSAYSPVMSYTTQVLDAAVQTINALHKTTPFDMGISLGDACNDIQYNEIRWYIDILVGGKTIQPSSGAHLGAGTIDYQKPYYAVGLDPAIPWYQTMGNHDHFWLGSDPVTAVPMGTPQNPAATADLRATYTGSNVITLPQRGSSNGQFFYAGVVDGSTALEQIASVGPVTNSNTAMSIPSGADPNRYAMTRNQWMSEFITSGTTVVSGTNPVGHGFTVAASGSGFACYSFVPKSNIPIKVIVLDDTDGDNDVVTDEYTHGTLDAARWAWLQSELALGDSNNQLMIIAAHVPIMMQNPSSDGANASSAGWLDPSTNGTSNGSAVSQAQLMTELHSHPNLLMWLSGHLHLNVVTPLPDPSLDPTRGFWEVETSSLRDLPQQLRTFQITLNSDDTVSIFSVNVDPSVAKGSPAATSRNYGVAALRLFYPNGLIARPSYSLSAMAPVNVELVKQLTPPMASLLRSAAANYGTPIGVLSSITVSGGTLSPVFNPSVTAYSGTVAGSLTAVTATPWYSYANPLIQMTANGVTRTLASGTASAPVSLNMGVNTITVTVGGATPSVTPTPNPRPGRPTPTPVNPVRSGTTYTLTITRVLSSTPELSGLALDASPMDPQFTPSGTNYSASVASTVSSVTVTPTKANPTDTIAVCVNNGSWQSVISGNASGSLALSGSAGANLIGVMVTGTNGAQKLYTLTVNRLSLPVTGPASGVDATTATLNATVDQNAPLVAFQYGPTAAYGSTTPWETVPAGYSSGSTAAVLAGIVGLAPSSVYHYRVAVNTGSTVQYGSDVTFVTTPDYSVLPVASQGSQAPGIPNTQFVSFGSPAINDLSNLAFQAVVTGSGITAYNNHGIWAPAVSGSNITPTLIVRTGQSTLYYSSLTGTTPQLATFTALGDPLFDNNNRIAFIGTATTGAAGSAQQSIFAETTGTLVRVAGLQDQAADCAQGSLISSFQQLVLPDVGGVVFVANLTVGVGGVTASNSQGLWLADATGQVGLVARTGDVLVTDQIGTRKTIASIAIFTATTGVGAQTRSFNSKGTLVYTITFTDGTQSIYSL